MSDAHARAEAHTALSNKGMCSSAASYYSGIDAQVLGAAGLKSALHNLIDGHTVVSYDNAWDAIAVLDASPTDATKVIGIYSDHEHDATAARGVSTGWNREHSWPKSYGVDYSGPDFSDLHALYAADWNVNSARSNLYFDDCPVSAGCSSPAHSEASATTAKDSHRFQPPADRRGDLARSMFYMAVRYDGSESSTSDLELAEVPDAGSAKLGVLSTLLAWHAADPVSQREAARNAAICNHFQANRVRRRMPRIHLRGSRRAHMTPRWRQAHAPLARYPTPASARSLQRGWGSVPPPPQIATAPSTGSHPASY